MALPCASLFVPWSTPQLYEVFLQPTFMILGVLIARFQKFTSARSWACLFVVVYIRIYVPQSHGIWASWCWVYHPCSTGLHEVLLKHALPCSTSLQFGVLGIFPNEVTSSMCSTARYSVLETMKFRPNCSKSFLNGPVWDFSEQGQIIGKLQHAPEEAINVNQGEERINNFETRSLK